MKKQPIILGYGPFDPRRAIAREMVEKYFATAAGDLNAAKSSKDLSPTLNRIYNTGFWGGFTVAYFSLAGITFFPIPALGIVCAAGGAAVVASVIHANVNANKIFSNHAKIPPEVSEENNDPVKKPIIAGLDLASTYMATLAKLFGHSLGLDKMTETEEAIVNGKLPLQSHVRIVSSQHNIEMMLPLELLVTVAGGSEARIPQAIQSLIGPALAAFKDSLIQERAFRLKENDALGEKIAMMERQAAAMGLADVFENGRAALNARMVKAVVNQVHQPAP